MLTRTEIQHDLLQKFDDLCKKANVKYVLHGHAAFLAYLNEPFNQVNTLAVLMCQGDAEKLSDFLDDDEYYFEDSRTNPKFDRSFMMFGFKNSIDFKAVDLNFNTTRNIDNHCIRIFIHFIERPLNTINGKILRGNRKILKFKSMDKDFNYRNYKSKRKMVNRLFKFINDDFYNKRIYNFKKKSISINTWEDIKNYPLIKITGKRPIESDVFDWVPVDFDGISTFIIKDFNKYAKHFYGQNWKDKNWPSPNPFSSTLISWDEYINDPDVKKGMDEIDKRYDIIHQKYIRTAEDRDVIVEMKKQIRQSKRVIYTREDMLSKKDKIMDLYQREDMKELEKILDPLINALLLGTYRGYTFSVDEDIDNVVDSYLRKTNDSELADEIKKLRVDV